MAPHVDHHFIIEIILASPFDLLPGQAVPVAGSQNIYSPVPYKLIVNRIVIEWPDINLPQYESVFSHP